MCFKKNKAEKQEKAEKRTKNTEKETPKAVKKELTKNEVKQEESKKTETKKVVAKKAETKKVETKKGETKKADTKTAETKKADSAEVKAPKERKALYRVVYSKELKVWQIKKDGAKRVIDSKHTKEEALIRVRELSESQDSNFVVQKKDGKFQKKANLK